MKARSLAEAKINGNKLIHLVENVSTDQKLKNLLQNAKNALQGNDLNEINNAIAELENSSLELCELTDRYNSPSIICTLSPGVPITRLTNLMLSFLVGLKTTMSPRFGGV
ncbi:hypothetical protein TNCT_232151 [Trichonephila clavata]|uniref:Uncharacterized protein n=1 Tax=Trichonephila clavata TaxID=2740835 RepID=A0A8X6K720_TRICU|nr:hypothetical protein TNCT_232151 [Trichonephila clavata]